MSKERWARVGDVLTLARRGVEVDPTGEYEEIGIRSFGRGIFHKASARGVDLGRKRVFRIEPGDLVISNVFAWEGAIAVASQAEVNKIGSHRFMTFVPTDDRIDPRWAAWYFLSEPGLELIRRASPGSAGRNRTLAIERFENLEIPLPPIGTQRRAAARLESAAQRCAVLTSEMDRARDLAGALRVAMVSPDALTAQERREQGWRSTAIGDLVEGAGASELVEPSVSYRVAGVYSFGRGLIDRGEIVGSDTSYRTLTRLRENDIVFSKLGAWEGAVSVVTPDFVGYTVSSEFPTFAMNTDLLEPRFFLGVTRAPWFWAAMNADTRGSMARRKRIAPDQFLRAQISLPSLEHQRRVAAYLGELDRVEAMQADASAHRDALVPSIMNREFADYG